MRKILASLTTATLAVGGLLVATAAPASAHTPVIDPTCDSLRVDLTAYEGAEVTVTVDDEPAIVDGKPVTDVRFDDSFHAEFPLDPTEGHRWTVDVEALDDDYYDWDDDGTTQACVDEGSEIQTAFYVYPKLDPNKDAAWENSGYQTLIATRDGGEFWEELPKEYPGEIFDVEELPADVCEGSWGVQQDIVGIHEGFDWTDFQHIEFEKGGPRFDDLKKWRHEELSTYLSECDESTPAHVTPEPPAFDGTCDAEYTVDQPEDTADVTYETEWNEAGTEATVTATLTEGVTPAPDAATSWTYTFTDEVCQSSPAVVTPEVPESVDLCGVENDTLTLPESTEQVVYTEEADGIVATATDGQSLAELPAGYETRDDGSAFYPTEAATFTDEPCALIPGDITAVCESAVPYLGYEVSLPQGVEADGDTPLTVTFLNPDGDDYEVTDQPLAGRLLWPGASATEPLQWPGWERLDDGTYVETDGNYAWTREGVQVRFEVNPDYSTVVDYPPASSECANAPADVEPVADTEVEAAEPPAELPRTGATVGIVAAIAALLVAAGATLFVVRRRLRQD